MNPAFNKLLIVTVVLMLPKLISIQQTTHTTIEEPGVIKLDNLFRSADTVAVVKVVSGDTENYATAVYKGEVLKALKGASQGETVYFGPYIGNRLGGEYVLFLRNVEKTLAPNPTSRVNYGTVHVLEVFNQGYSSMETSYQCVFDGKEIAQRCDYGVRVCTDYIVLPKSLPTFPPTTADTPFGCRWVRKDVFVSLLDSLRETRK